MVDGLQAPGWPAARAAAAAGNQQLVAEFLDAIVDPAQAGTPVSRAWALAWVLGAALRGELAGPAPAEAAEVCCGFVLAAGPAVLDRRHFADLALGSLERGAPALIPLVAPLCSPERLAYVGAAPGAGR